MDIPDSQNISDDDILIDGVNTDEKRRALAAIMARQRVFGARLALKDTERLDWLENNPGKISTGVGSAKWWILGQEEFAANKANDLRSAIDAAMEAKS